jgi:hypothetical protein
MSCSWSVFLVAPAAPPRKGRDAGGAPSTCCSVVSPLERILLLDGNLICSADRRIFCNLIVRFSGAANVDMLLQPAAEEVEAKVAPSAIGDIIIIINPVIITMSGRPRTMIFIICRFVLLLCGILLLYSWY